MGTQMMDVLSAAATLHEKGKRSTIPDVTIPTLEASCVRWREVSRLLEPQIPEEQIKSCEAEKKFHGSTITTAAESSRIELSRKIGLFLSSVRINGILYTAKKQFSDITDQGELDRLKNISGLAPYLKERVLIEVDPRDLSPEWQSALVALRDAGQATLSRKLTINPQYLIDRTMRTDVAELHSMALVRNVCSLKA